MTFPLETERWETQQQVWPQQGYHLLAHYDDTTIIVYQAYRPAIAEYAVRHGHFGGEFSPNRMSWIKPGFLWMMHRSGWATKPDQERILAVRLPREVFETLTSRSSGSNSSLSRQCGTSSRGTGSASCSFRSLPVGWRNSCRGTNRS
jgi:hypothetical protein